MPADVLAHTVGVGAVGSRPVAVAHGRDISSVGDEAFGEQKPLGQLDIRARRAHGHRQWSSADPDLEWLFDHENVWTRSTCGGVDAGDTGARRDTAHSGSPFQPDGDSLGHRRVRPAGNVIEPDQRVGLGVVGRGVTPLPGAD